MPETKTILMVAAENDALPGAKVGGIGDVVRDLPAALARQGHHCHVVIPSYGYLHELPGAVPAHHYSTFFGGGVESATLYRIDPSKVKPGTHPQANVTLWVIEHPGLYPFGKGVLYCDDGKERPFASDATKYALFSTIVAQAVINDCFGHLDVLHLHDWHSAFIAILRAYEPRYAALQKLHTVYSIHNLSLQGVRPFRGDVSSFSRWFPSMSYDEKCIRDPRATECVNPMRAAIVLADKVHAVSPSYAKEIQRPSHPEELLYGGEGLQDDLVRAQQQGRLEGILNGCEYGEDAVVGKLDKDQLIEVLQDAVTHFAARQTSLQTAHWLANIRLEQWSKSGSREFVLTSVGRITEQKVRLLREVVSYQGVTTSVLDHLLSTLKGKGIFILLGSGDADYEQFLTQASARHEHFVFLRGYSDTASEALYVNGDLFLMPSSFEPCGISQMLAMRAGQPCLVHGVGGLNDTVEDSRTGFVFRGDNAEHQGQQLISRLTEVLNMPKQKLQAIAKRAEAARFTWDSVAEQYAERLYR